jgi:drug/metabolite transporter (DMT)-like permease
MSILAPRFQGPFLALVGFAGFSLHDVIVKVLGASYSPVQIVFFSALFGFPLLTLMLIRDSQPGTLRPNHPWWTALRTLLTTVTAFSAFYAFTVLPLAQTYALLFAAPLLITVLSIPMLGERVGPRRLGAVFVGLCGVLVVLQPGTSEFTLGHIAGVTAAVCSATGAVIMRKIGREERSAVMLLYPMLANIVVMGAALPLVYEPMPLLDMAGLVAIAVIALAATTALIMAYRRGSAVSVAPMQYSQIIWATVWGMLFFAETPSPSTILGAAIIIASGIYIVLREDRANVSENQPVLNTRSRADTGTYPRISVLTRLPEDEDEAGSKSPLAKETGSD